ncbi:para-nitrobenzyl esterase [Coccidioides immitis RMSCC 2394]|uniref:Carboxylic ester hydrolase n=1 Tax=Coccidioides immitis RMSCC 2394 TaxID=404692 RepID=A0A0J7B329_COCIT|nr:para-nitrobenzyl esterase [Coccidioides immitis RMSCC 2394]
METPGLSKPDRLSSRRLAIFKPPVACSTPHAITSVSYGWSTCPQVETELLESPGAHQGLTVLLYYLIYLLDNYWTFCVLPMHDQMDIIIQLPSGTISAAQKENLVHARGVPYAHAKRFEPPQSIAPWEGVVDYTRPSTICPQAPSRLDMVTGPLAKGRAMDEDCTHLSIAAPIGGQNLPVMVFFHGGAYLTGGGDLDCYQGLELAARGVVVVSVTYRLGIFGYLQIPGIAPANLGLLDQIEALNWVKNNILSFGGDPSNVTLFGESAGADSIFCLMAAEGTEGLFHRAILQSAPIGRRYDKSAESLTLALSKVAEEKLQSLAAGSPSIEEMLSIQLQLLITAKKLGSRGMPFAPSFGQHPLPQISELDDVIRKRAKDIPVLISCTKDEGTPFAAMNDRAARFFTIPLLGRCIRWLVSWLITKKVFHSPSKHFQKQVLAAGGKCSSFYFRWAPPSSPWGAAHTIDLPFLLGSWSSWEDAPMLGGSKSRDVVERVGSHVKDVWVAFSKGVDLGSNTLIIDESFRSEHCIKEEKFKLTSGILSGKTP